MTDSTTSSDDRLLAAQAETDALMAMVTDRITLETFDPNDRQLMRRMVFEGLGDARGLVRLRFAETLGEIGEVATPILLEALADKSNVVLRRAATKTLTIIADPRAVPALLDAFLHDEDTVVNGSAAGALARTGETAVPALLDILASPEYAESTKGHAAWALAFIGAEAAEHLYKAMGSDSVDVRCAAIAAIAQVAQTNSDERACNILIAALTDAAVAIRNEAAATLGQVNYPPAIPHLILALRDSDVDVRKAAVSSLGKVGDTTALEPLRAALDDEEEPIRLLAKLAISKLERRLAEGDDE
ncbi:HEAT repeat domain-containing protein [Pseudanabaena sp. PCC 6802]|uniref:HEAT repeat domain-containing protein n=1 Tax=Pseudanabaena sp. PCC 6802 TaxID=118173 RepID=UPI00034B6628|nr:HEAT repeat domain-containing protein [Pseudanabaena sp. PCC 6802]